MFRAKNRHYNIPGLKIKKGRKNFSSFRFQYLFFFLNNVCRSMHNHLIFMIIKDLIFGTKYHMLDFFQKTINTML